MARESRLGRGLDSLIPPSESALDEGDLRQIALSQIQPNPHQPRTEFAEDKLAELAESIRTHGVIQPLIIQSTKADGIYTLIAGERRMQAARLAGLTQVPVVLREANNQELVELALVENVQRADLSPLESAEAYLQLHKEFGLSHKEIAQRVGKSRVAITNTLGLLELSKEVKAALAENKISEGHARAIKTLATAQAQNAMLDSIVKQGLNVRQAEELARKLKGKKKKPEKKPVAAPETLDLQNRLRASLGTKVSIQHGVKGGRVTLYYYSDEELNKLSDKLLGE